MRGNGQGWRQQLVEAAQSIAFGVWVAAAVIIPASLLLKSYDTALLTVILVFFWQLLSAALTSTWRAEPSRSRSRFHFRLTNWGALYGAIAGTFSFMSLHWGINLLYLTAAFLLAGALCAGVWPWLVLSKIEVSWDVPEHVFAREPFSVAVKVRNAKRLFSAFGLWLGLEGTPEAASAAQRPVSRLRPGQSVGVPLQQYLPRRGLHRLHPLSVRTTFPFGMLEAAREAQLRREVLVLPHVGHINQDMMRRHGESEVEWVASLRRMDPEGEFRGLREYQHGDNPRNIHWPTSARLQKLYVREFERQELHSVLVLLDAHAPSDGAARSREWLARFEGAVSFAATLAALFTRLNVFQAFASYCPDLVTLPYDSGRGHLFSVLEVLALATPSPEHSLGHLAHALSSHEVSTGGIALVTPGPVSREDGAAMLGSLAQSVLTIDVSRPEFNEIFTP